MTKSEITQEALQLPLEEQLELAQELWANISPPDFELTPELRKMLRERLAEAKANPGAGVPWEEAHQRIKTKLANRQRP